jgi:hypothetical protein
MVDGNMNEWTEWDYDKIVEYLTDTKKQYTDEQFIKFVSLVIYQQHYRAK